MSDDDFLNNSNADLVVMDEEEDPPIAVVFQLKYKH